MSQKYLIVNHCEVPGSPLYARFEDDLQSIRYNPDYKPSRESKIITNVDQIYDPILIKEGQTPEEAIYEFLDKSDLDKIIPDLHGIEVYVSGVKSDRKTAVSQNGEVLRAGLVLQIYKTYTLKSEVSEDKKNIITKCIDAAVDGDFFPEFDDESIDDGGTPEETFYRLMDWGGPHCDGLGDKEFRWDGAFKYMFVYDYDTCIIDGGAMYQKTKPTLEKLYYFTFRVEERGD